ncbi:MAG TPA: Hsp20/alpha crystallin family protein [Candidatus Angelobacter sp.]|jgi:HSP20 family protein|nr:Hsp20/alpha crystallin family protein [Candidatus Angelobacter sp.]
MANITRFDPLAEFARLQDRFTDFLQPFSPLSLTRAEQALTRPDFVPAVNVFEDEHNITIEADLPGVDDKDLDIRLENNVLTISGERKFENEEKKENFHRIERSYGRFTRSFTLPPTVETENVNAEFNNGVLKITLNKKEEAKPKQIKIGLAKVPAKGKAA